MSTYNDVYTIVSSFAILGNNEELSEEVIGTNCDFMVMFISKCSI